MNKAVRFFKDWMLPLAIATGISLYLFYHFTPVLKPYGTVLHKVASEGQRLVIALLLFFQFVQISPHDIRLHRWHLWAMLVQVLGFGLFAGLSVLAPEGPGRILLECAMICLICPCAAAAGVITKKLDGDLAATVSYLCLTNLAATFLIPMVIPMIRPASDLGFWVSGPTSCGSPARCSPSWSSRASWPGSSATRRTSCSASSCASRPTPSISGSSG